MQQNWSIRSRAHECALTGRPFEDGEIFHTAIYFDPEENGYVRKDVCREAWKDQVAKQKPVASWKTMYQKVIAEARPEIAPKESAMELLQRFIEEGDPMTENARYILALMLERKRQITQTAEKEVEGNKMLFYENKKTGEIFIVRDPELRLDEVAQIQEEVATILAFGGPAADAAKAVGVTLTPHGVVPAPDANAAGEDAAAAAHAEESAAAEAAESAAPEGDAAADSASVPDADAAPAPAPDAAAASAAIVSETEADSGASLLPEENPAPAAAEAEAGGAAAADDAATSDDKASLEEDFPTAQLEEAPPAEQPAAPEGAPSADDPAEEDQEQPPST